MACTHHMIQLCLFFLSPKHNRKPSIRVSCFPWAYKGFVFQKKCLDEACIWIVWLNRHTWAIGVNGGSIRSSKRICRWLLRSHHHHLLLLLEHESLLLIGHSCHLNRRWSSHCIRGEKWIVHCWLHRHGSHWCWLPWIIAGILGVSPERIVI